MGLDEEKYRKILAGVGQLSSLYSDDPIPYLNSKFVEKLFAYCSDSRNVAGQDMSFDAITSELGGVGVKTFRANSPASGSVEKIAEFTAHATSGEFLGLSELELIQKVSAFRNERVLTDVRAYGLTLENSYYHCLIRTSAGCMIHEEPYNLIQLDSLKVLEKKKKNPTFTDGLNHYTFSLAKNVLYKKFSPVNFHASKLIKIRPRRDLFKYLSTFSLFDDASGLKVPKKIVEPSIVLPLYGSNGEVERASGINQWNAGGRKRSFGEGYIPFPAKARQLFPSFFPTQEKPFTIRLADGRNIIAKVCQDDGKAIMSNPNNDLLGWLFKILDSSDDETQARFRERRPYTYSDLRRVGKDSVLFKLIDAKKQVYSLEPMPLGSYEEFLREQVGITS